MSLTLIPDRAVTLKTAKVDASNPDALGGPNALFDQKALAALADVLGSGQLQFPTGVLTASDLSAISALATGSEQDALAMLRQLTGQPLQLRDVAFFADDLACKAAKQVNGQALQVDGALLDALNEGRYGAGPISALDVCFGQLLDPATLRRAAASIAPLAAMTTQAAVAPPPPSDAARQPTSRQQLNDLVRRAVAGAFDRGGDLVPFFWEASTSRNSYRTNGSTVASELSGTQALQLLSGMSRSDLRQSLFAAIAGRFGNKLDEDEIHDRVDQILGKMDEVYRTTMKIEVQQAAIDTCRSGADALDAAANKLETGAQTNPESLTAISQLLRLSQGADATPVAVTPATLHAAAQALRAKQATFESLPIWDMAGGSVNTFGDAYLDARGIKRDSYAAEALSAAFADAKGAENWNDGVGFVAIVGASILTAGLFAEAAGAATVLRGQQMALEIGDFPGVAGSRAIFLDLANDSATSLAVAGRELGAALGFNVALLTIGAAKRSRQ